MFEDQCISELMNQNFANCPTTTPNEIDLIEVDNGIIFLNNVINTKVKEEEFILNGTFLINCNNTIFINGTKFEPKINISNKNFTVKNDQNAFFRA